MAQAFAEEEEDAVVLAKPQSLYAFCLERLCQPRRPRQLLHAAADAHGEHARLRTAKGLDLMGREVFGEVVR